MKLYEITGSMKEIETMISDGVPEDQLADTIDMIKGDFESKGESILFLLANLSGDIEAFKTEEKRLSDRRRAIEKSKAKLEEYLVYNMQAMKLKKISGGIKSASLSKPKPVLKITDESLIPDEYRSIKVVDSIDKKAALTALKAGTEIPGATIGESKPGLTIK